MVASFVICKVNLMDILSQILTENNTSGTYDKTLKEKCATNLELFCMTYFPDVFSSEFCEFHRELFEVIENTVLNKSNEKSYICRAAPRGHGKSQIISFAVPLWCVAYSYRKNIVIVSDTGAQALQFIQDIKNQIEDNEYFIRDFGSLVGIGGKPWKQNEIVTQNNIHLIAKSAGQKLRGIKYNSVRPDMIIIDDLENDENVETDDQREKLFRWFTKALLKCGDKRTIHLFIGTIMHYEAMLFKVLHDKNFAMWNRKIYQAVYEFSNSPLWNKWEEIITDPSSDTARDDAKEFYLKNKEEMLFGTSVLWPGKDEHQYYELMIERVMDSDAFNSEFQNDPVSEETRIFKEQWINGIIYDDLPVEITRVAMAVDPSLGKNKRADTSAILALGLGTDNRMYSLTADVCRRSPDKIMDDVIMYAVQYLDKLGKFRVEINVWQEFFSTEMQKRCLAAGIHIDWDEVRHTRDKDLRIKSLVPSIKHGYIRIHRSHVVLISQLKNYPKAKDDGVDCLQMCADALVGSGVSSAFSFSKISTTAQPKSTFSFKNFLR